MLKKEIIPERQQVNSPQCAVQLPDQQGFKNISQMITGGEEDDTQQRRILNIKQAIPNDALIEFITTGEKNNLITAQWQAFFAAFQPMQRISTRNSGDDKKKADVKEAFNRIPADDPLKQTLLTIHTQSYIYKIIDACINAQTAVKEDGSNELADRFVTLDDDEDVVIQPFTFEVLIRDFATSIHIYEQHKAANIPLFSLGLPTHHAYQDSANGFCIFNKVAMLIAYFKQKNVIICGLDINADDGLQDCLTGLVRNAPIPSQVIYHYDIYDSQVWPNRKFTDNKVENNNSTYHYNAINMKEDSNSRKNNLIHPVMRNLIQIIAKQAEKYGNKLAIYVALGWDSHQDETASCGKVSMRDARREGQYRNEKRFHDIDFFWFYQQLIALEKEYKIEFLYIGLEGGYTQKVYRQQSQGLIDIACGKKELNNKMELVDKVDKAMAVESSDKEEATVKERPAYKNTKSKKRLKEEKTEVSSQKVSKKIKSKSAASIKQSTYPPKLLDEVQNTNATNNAQSGNEKKPVRRSPRKKAI